MKATTLFTAFIVLFINASLAQQARPIDTTIKLGKSGYRIKCNNKKPDKNTFNINPIGFESGARDYDLEVKGRVIKAEVDDLNNDGFADVVVYVVNYNDHNKGYVIGISSSKNEGMVPMLFPDIMDDPKLRVGYMGYDEFTLLQGTMLRTFPLYDTIDPANPKPTGLYRNVHYRVVATERGTLKFVVLRTYDVDRNKK
jgi:hypothetical protein